jgi:hypothetical protein
VSRLKPPKHVFYESQRRSETIIPMNPTSQNEESDKKSHKPSPHLSRPPYLYPPSPQTKYFRRPPTPSSTPFSVPTSMPHVPARRLFRNHLVEWEGVIMLCMYCAGREGGREDGTARFLGTLLGKKVGGSRSASRLPRNVHVQRDRLMSVQAIPLQCQLCLSKRHKRASKPIRRPCISPSISKPQ